MTHIEAAKTIARQHGEIGCGTNIRIIRQVARITGTIVSPRSKAAEEILHAYREERHAMYQEKQSLKRLARAFEAS